MATSYISSNIFGAGPLFTFAGEGDHLVIAPNVTAGSTTGSALAGLAQNDIALTVMGTLISPGSVAFTGSDAVIHIAAGGAFLSTRQTSADAGMFLVGPQHTLINDGSFSTPSAVGVLSSGENEIVNNGTIQAASPIFIGLFGAAGDSFVNSGSVTANSYDDAAQTGRYNNAVMAEGTNTLVTNLATGILTAVSTEGAGVRFNAGAGGSVLNNFGQITSVQDYGVNLGTVTLGEALIRVINTGTITGFDGSYLGSVNEDALINRGEMIGDVLMGDGDDTLYNSNGTIEGVVNMGDGDDRLVLGADREFANGGAGSDTVDLRHGTGGIIDLTGEGRGTGLALGDILNAFERVYGSTTGVDRVFGNDANNAIYTYDGNDVILGGAGTDTIYGGRGADRATGGIGNDTFGYASVEDFGDIITDFSSSATGNNDRFQFRLSGVDAGVDAGTLSAARFQTRADNEAQDTNDRFIFRTTDKTLWFDADGSGDGDPIMVADLQSSATVTALDIVFI